MHWFKHKRNHIFDHIIKHEKFLNKANLIFEYLILSDNMLST